MKVNLAGMHAGEVSFSQNVDAAWATIQHPVSADPPVYHVELLFSFRGIRELDVPADRIRPLWRNASLDEYARLIGPWVFRGEWDEADVEEDELTDDEDEWAALQPINNNALTVEQTEVRAFDGRGQRRRGRDSNPR